MNYFGYHHSFNNSVVTLSIVFVLLNFIARWRLFSKACHWGLSAFIPIISDIILCRIVRISPLWLLCFLIPGINIIFTLLYHLIISFRLAYAYGKGTLFAFGLIFFNPLFILILGFGNCEYVY